MTEVANDAVDQNREDQEWRASEQRLSTWYRKEHAKGLRAVDQRCEPLRIASHVVPTRLRAREKAQIRIGQMLEIEQTNHLPMMRRPA